MNKILVLLLITAFAFGCSNDGSQSEDRTLYKGMDLSFQPELTSNGVVYMEADGTPSPLLEQVKRHGANLVRLRLWYSASASLHSLNAVKEYALQIKQNNMALLLDIHYSETWADPSYQTPPTAWQNQSLESLRETVYQYTKTVMTELTNQGTAPALVQIGNETDSGFLWDYGRVWDAFDNNWGNLAALIGKAAQAVREVNPETQIVLHHSSVEQAHLYFGALAPYAVDFDVIGLSYYPQFQTKNLVTVQNNLNQLAQVFDKKIMIVETAYPFTFGYDDNLGNFIGDASQIIPEFPASPAGQKAFLEKMTEIMSNIPNEKGLGWVYWAPDWVAFPGNETTYSGGSAWENQALWDFDHKALPALDAFSP